MKNATIIEEPPKIVRPKVDGDVLASISSDTLEDSFVYVHCHFDNLGEEMLIRIWNTTFIIDKSAAVRSQLVHAENISIAPQWTMVPPDTMFNFLLIFPGLPKSCKVFDLVEEISQPGGFCVRNITRNETDVYHIDI